MPSNTYMSAIEEAEQELRRLQKEHSDLLKKIDALQTFIRSGLALTGSEQSASHIIPSTLVPSLSGAQIPVASTEAIPMADQVAQILRNAGRPLHMREIVRQLRTMRNLERSARPERTIWTAMKRRRNQFKKVAPNTYQLAVALQ